MGGGYILDGMLNPTAKSGGIKDLSLVWRKLAANSGETSLLIRRGRIVADTAEVNKVEKNRC